MAELLIKQVKSANGRSPRQRDTLRTLRLGRIGKSVVREDTEQLHGLLRKVEQVARQRGIEEGFVLTDEDNAAAMCLYESVGGVRNGVVEWDFDYTDG